MHFLKNINGVRNNVFWKTRLVFDWMDGMGRGDDLHVPNFFQSPVIQGSPTHSQAHSCHKFRLYFYLYIHTLAPLHFENSPVSTSSWCYLGQVASTRLVAWDFIPFFVRIQCWSPPGNTTRVATQIRISMEMMHGYFCMSSRTRGKRSNLSGTSAFLSWNDDHDFKTTDLTDKRGACSTLRYDFGPLCHACEFQSIIWKTLMKWDDHHSYAN